MRIETIGIRGSGTRDKEANTYMPPRPNIGDVFLCEHGFVIEVVRRFDRSNFVRTLRPKDNPIRYRRAIRAIKREERKKVLAERWSR